MVLADRTAENVRNGRRSRGPSPNGHSAVLVAGGITESSSDDENSRKNGNSSKAAKAKSEYEEKIRVGRDYQAVCPELIPSIDRKPENLNDRALLVWSPTKEIPDIKLEEYITVAKEKYGYNGEQALGMLFWHKHDLERAVLDLANFTPFPDEWTVEDKVLFEQAFQFHGKSFHRIRQMLPDKSIASLVKFYYSWKKTRSRTSVMDRQEKMKKNDSSENGSDHGSNEDSDNDDKPSASTGSNPAPVIPSAINTTVNVAASTTGGVPSTNGTAQTVDASDSSKPGQMEVDSESAIAPSTTTNGGSTSSSNSLNCSGCGVTCSELNATPQGKLCGSCYHHWRRTGVLRPTSGPTFMNKRARNSTLLGKSADSHKRRPPRGMYINHDDIVKLADSAQMTSGAAEGKPCEDLLAGMDREIVSLWSQIQLNKQSASGLKRRIEQESDIARPTEPTMIRVNSRWNNEELLLAVQGVRKFGRDFQAIADTIGTKTETQLRTFFVNYRRKYNLDNVLKEYEAEQKQLLELMNNNISMNNNNNNNIAAKEDDSTTTISELESADTNSTAGDKLDLEDGKKSTGTKSVPLDGEIMEIDLVDDEVVNGKKSQGEDGLDGSCSTVTASDVLSASSLPNSSLSVTSAVAGASVSAATEETAPMDVDEQSSSSTKLTDSTVVIK